MKTSSESIKTPKRQAFKANQEILIFELYQFELIDFHKS
mgnify:FL=1